jgi:hypothetical protein
VIAAARPLPISVAPCEKFSRLITTSLRGMVPCALRFTRVAATHPAERDTRSTFLRRSSMAPSHSRTYRAAPQTSCGRSLILGSWTLRAAFPTPHTVLSASTRHCTGSSHMRQPCRALCFSRCGSAGEVKVACAVHSFAPLLQNNASATSPNGAGMPLLPLQRAHLAGGRVAVIGPNANATQTLLSNFHGSNTLADNQSVVMALTRVGESAGFSVRYAPGCVDGNGPGANVTIACSGTLGFEAALDAVRNATVAIVVVGWCADDCPSPSDAPIREAEGNDRPFTRWVNTVV